MEDKYEAARALSDALERDGRRYPAPIRTD